MRQQQQNRRGRGRNRKGQNPLTRSFESNGPDIKIRGTASHIAEKYVSLARDAMASGDPVLAENYLQHAEHYNRIIMTYREQQAQPGDPLNGANGHGRPRSISDHDSDFGDDEGMDDIGFAPIPRGSEPQPDIASVSHEAGEPQQQRRPQRRDDRSSGDGAEHQQQGGGGGRANGRGRRQRYMQSDDQPEFLKRPVRRPRHQESDDEEGSVASSMDADLGPSADQAAE